MVPGLSAWLLVAALVAQGPAAPPGVDVAVTATAPIDAQHLADVLRAYLDEYGVRVESVAAFRELFQAHVGGVHRIVYRMVGPVPDLDDLVQTVFVEAFRSLPAFRGEALFSTWLARIAVRVTMHEVGAILNATPAAIKVRVHDARRFIEKRCRRDPRLFDLLTAGVAS